MRAYSKNTFWHAIQHRKACALLHWLLVMFYYCGNIRHASDVAQLSLLYKQKLKALIIGERISLRYLLTGALPSISSSIFQNKKVWKALGENLLRHFFFGKTVLCTTTPCIFLTFNANLREKRYIIGFSALEDRVTHSNLDVAEISIPGTGKTRQNWTKLIQWLLSWTDAHKVICKHLFLTL